MDVVLFTCDLTGEILAGGGMLNSARGVLIVAGSTFVAWVEATGSILIRSGLNGRPNHHVLDVFTATEGHHGRLRYGFLGALR